jgi:hypothetical protein
LSEEKQEFYAVGNAVEGAERIVLPKALGHLRRFNRRRDYAGPDSTLCTLY